MKHSQVQECFCSGIKFPEKNQDFHDQLLTTTSHYNYNNKVSLTVNTSVYKNKNNASAIIPVGFVSRQTTICQLLTRCGCQTVAL